MRKLWGVAGITGFWLLSPLLFVYLRLNARTRVVIEQKDEVLLVKPWLGTGQWDLPGGGLHVSESPLAGLLRETFEETGIELPKQKVKSLGLRRGRGLFPPSVHCFYVKLAQKPKVKKQFVEIIDIRWVPKPDLPGYRLSPHSQVCVDLWKSQA